MGVTVLAGDAPAQEESGREVKRTALALVTLAACAPAAPPLPRYGSVPAFSMRDQSARAIGDPDFRGSVWVADFIFTSCAGVCPLLTRRMAEVARWADSEKIAPAKFRLASFTVDPARDTPERLAAYAKENAIDGARWSLLTGEPTAVERAIVAGFKIAVSKEKPEPGERADTEDGFAILHGTKLILIDGAGSVRGYFDSDPEGLRALETAAAQLIAHGGT